MPLPTNSLPPPAALPAPPHLSRASGLLIEVVGILLVTLLPRSRRGEQGLLSPGNWRGCRKVMKVLQI